MPFVIHTDQPPPPRKKTLAEQHQRYRTWWSCLAVFWALMGLMLLAFWSADVSEVQKINDIITGWETSRAANAATQLAIWQAIHGAVSTRLWVDLLATAAGGIAIWLGFNPSLWALDFRRFAGVVFATATVLGRPLMGVLLAAAGASPGNDGDLASSTEIPRLILSLFAPMLMPLLGMLTLAAFLGWIAFCLYLVRFVLISIPLWVIEYLRSSERKRHKRQQSQSVALQYLDRFGRWLQGEAVGALPDDGQGSRFALPSEVAAAQNSGGLGFGYINGQPLQLATDKHIFIQASTRSGKGVAIIIPHLLRYPGSVFVLDPKGENAKATARQRARLNDKLCVLDPFNITGLRRARFNPLTRFTPANMEAASKSLAAAFFLGERDHWTASGMQLVAALILYVYASPDFGPEQRDLVTVRRLLLGAVMPTLKAMRNDLNARLVDGLLNDVAASFLATPERELGSIISTAQRETEIIDNPYIAACLSANGDGDEVSFQDWRRGTMSVFLCLSAPRFPVFNRWLRLVLTSALDEMTDVLAPPEQPISFVLDELATLGHLPAVENAVGLAAGYGVQIFSVFQDTAQMRDLYKARWPSFIGNAGVRAVFNLSDYESAAYWSSFIGNNSETLLTHDIFGQPIQPLQENERPEIKPLLSPDEMMRLFAANKMIVLPQGVRPIIADRVPYWADKTLDGLWDDPRLPAAPWSDQPPPSEPPPETPPPPAPPPVPPPAPPALPAPPSDPLARPKLPPPWLGKRPEPPSD